MKYLGINITKHVLDLGTENDKMLIKDMKKCFNTWKAILCSQMKNAT